MNEEVWDEMEPNHYTLSFDNGVFVPCPFCGAEVAAPDCGFQSEADAMTWAIENCTCPASRKFEREEKRVLVGTFCETGKFTAETGGCQHFEGKACTKEKCSAYHPELEASALYSAGLDKWQAAQDAAKAWQDFEPVANMLAWAVRLPEPAPYWEPPKPQRIEVGTCHYCGQSTILPAPATSQAEADRKATELCQCSAGTNARRQMNERAIIAELFAEADQETLDLLFRVADLVRFDYIKPGTSIKVAENCAAKFKVKDGAVIITRSEKLEHQHSL